VSQSEAEDKSLKAQFAEIAEIAGGLAHEIRNPLSTMQLNLDLLAEEFAQQESHRDRRALQKVERVRKECHRLQDILEDFLRFVRVQGLRLVPADLNEVVDVLRDFHEGQATTQGVVLRTHYDLSLPKVVQAGAAESDSQRTPRHAGGW
jgi:signal transduction histidine kinase